MWDTSCKVLCYFKISLSGPLGQLYIFWSNLWASYISISGLKTIKVVWALKLSRSYRVNGVANNFLMSKFWEKFMKWKICKENSTFNILVIICCISINFWVKAIICFLWTLLYLLKNYEMFIWKNKCLITFINKLITREVKG